jgi:hypothetical protein
MQRRHEGQCRQRSDLGHRHHPLDAVVSAGHLDELGIHVVDLLFQRLEHRQQRGDLGHQMLR